MSPFDDSLGVEGLFELIFDSQLQFMAVLSPEGRVQRVNDLALTKQGYTSQDYVGKLFWESPAWKHLPRWKAIWHSRLREAYTTRKPVFTHDIYENHKGTICSADAVTTPLFDSEDALTGYLVQAVDTTEREATLRSLKLARQQYFGMMEDFPVMVCCCKSSGEITFVNQAYVEFLGVASDCLVGADFFSHIPDSERETFLVQLSSLTPECSTVAQEFKTPLNGGLQTWLRWNCRAIFDEDNQIVSYQFVGEDVTERLAQEQKVALSEARLSRLISNLPGVAFRCLNDTHWTMLYLSERCKDLFGYSPNDIIDNRVIAFSEVIEPEYREYVSQQVNASIAKNASYSIVYKAKRADNKVIWVEETGRVVLGDDSSELIEGYIEDITARIEAHSRLNQAAAVFRSTGEGVMITDCNGIILDVNKSFTKITGYSRKEVLGCHSSILRSERHDQNFYKNMWQEILQKGHWHGEIWNRAKNGAIYPEMLTISAIDYEPDKQPSGYVGVFADITSQKETEAHLDHLAHYDALTDLPNRLLIRERLIHSLIMSLRKRSKVAVLFLDLDRFKNVNDTLGHRVGDLLLVEIAARLKQLVRAGDTVGRISGDEFCFILEDIHLVTDVIPIVEKLVSVFRESIKIDKHTITISVSIGIAISPDNSSDADALLSYSDSAMYEAKEAGRNTYKFYTEEMTQQALEHSFVQSAMRNALDSSEFSVVYQPQILAQTNALVGVEVLARWQHPSQGHIAPDKFIKIAESSGLIRELGAWVLRKACEQGVEWLASGVQFGRLFVNVSVSQLHDESFLDVVSTCLRETGFSAKHLGFEVTESFIMKDPHHAIKVLSALKALNIQLAVDDFGTGYSSLSYLKQLPIDKLKIDRSFIGDIPSDLDDMAISEAIIAMGRALNLTVIAEGVENELQADFLIGKGCCEMQGYLYSSPLIASDFINWVNKLKQ